MRQQLGKWGARLESWEQARRMGVTSPREEGHPEEALLTANLAFLNLLEGSRWISFFN